MRETLKLEVNPKKSAVDRPWKRKFLGFSMTAHRECRVRVAAQAVGRFREAIRDKFRERRDRNLRALLGNLKPKLRGWASYFSVPETRNVFEELEQWPWPVVECGSIIRECAASDLLLLANGAHLLAGRGALVYDAARAAVFMTSVMRNRTSGGVGGR